MRHPPSRANQHQPDWNSSSAPTVSTSVEAVSRHGQFQAGFITYIIIIIPTAEAPRGDHAVDGVAYYSHQASAVITAMMATSAMSM